MSLDTKADHTLFDWIIRGGAFALLLAIFGVILIAGAFTVWAFRIFWHVLLP